MLAEYYRKLPNKPGRVFDFRGPNGGRLIYMRRLFSLL